MPPSGENTRLALTNAATLLFAEHGIERTSVDAIVKKAGAKNASAVTYHFGGKAKLLSAILELHRSALDDRRTQLLGDLDVSSRPSIEVLAQISIQPMIEHLTEPLGPEYLRIRSELLSRGDLDLELADAPLILEAAGDVDLGATGDIDREKRELVTTMIFHGIADFARRHPNATQAQRNGFGELLQAAMVAIGRIDPNEPQS